MRKRSVNWLLCKIDNVRREAFVISINQYYAVDIFKLSGTSYKYKCLLGKKKFQPLSLEMKDLNLAFR